MTVPFSADDALAAIIVCPLAVLVTDTDKRIHYYNPALAKLFGLPLVEPDSVAQQAAATIDLKVPFDVDEAAVTCADGEGNERHFAVQTGNLADERQMRVHFLIDVSQQKALEAATSRLDAELQAQILTDRHTGLLNSRGIMLALEPQVARSRRYNSAISVVMLHPGNADDNRQLLKAVASLLKDQLRWADLVGCSEHGEFILVLPETDAEAARKLTSLLTPKLQELGDRLNQGSGFSPRYGITAWRRTDSPITLLRRAASAMAQARDAEADGQLIAL